MIVAAAFFVLSLLGLAVLFTLKSIETKRERVFAANFRERADEAALSLKAQMFALRRELAKAPPALAYLTRFLLHELALAAARLARSAETQLHNVADLISHKRSFEKREPRSEFLKQMQEGKRSEAGSPDTNVDGEKESER